MGTHNKARMIPNNSNSRFTYQTSHRSGGSAQPASALRVCIHAQPRFICPGEAPVADTLLLQSEIILPLSRPDDLVPRMITTRTAASWRAFGKPALAGLLGFMLLLSAFASASHSLHGWLHQDHQSASHSCLVTLLEQGQGEVAATDTEVRPGPVGFPAPAQSREFFFLASDVVLCPERGPPLPS